MFQRIAIALGAGLASAVLFVAFARGTGLGILMAYFAPLPVMIAALGWRHMSGLAAALIGAAVIGLTLSPMFGALFAISLTLPGWWLAYLALLAQPGATPGTFNWYPLGRIVAWAIFAACLLPGVNLVLQVMNEGGYEASLAAQLGPATRLIEQIMGGADQLPEGFSAERMAGIVLQILPAMAASASVVLLLGNLWVAGRVVAASSRLPRPWPPVPENLALPRWILLALAGGGLLALMGGAAGAVGSIVAASSGTAIALQGLASVHRRSRVWPLRAPMLALIYAGLLVMSGGLALFLLIGILDVVSRRPRAGPDSGPPPADPAN